MDLFIGGYGQGKLEIVKAMYPNSIVYDERNYEELVNGEKQQLVLLNHFHLVMRDMLVKGMTAEERTQRIVSFLENADQLIIIADEIGNGIVPLDPTDREYREQTGRCLTQLAKQADKVGRITCGLVQVLK